MPKWSSNVFSKNIESVNFEIVERMDFALRSRDLQRSVGDHVPRCNRKKRRFATFLYNYQIKFGISYSAFFVTPNSPLFWG